MNIFIVLMVIYIVAMLILGYLGSKRATDSTSYATSNGDVSVMFRLPSQQHLPARAPSWVSPARASPMA